MTKLNFDQRVARMVRDELEVPYTLALRNVREALDEGVLEDVGRETAAGAHEPVVRHGVAGVPRLG